jgi:TatD DNase family protein
MAIDSHLHINSRQIEDVNKTIKELNNAANIERVINVGIDIETSQEAVEIAKNNKKMYVAVGIHPMNIYHQNMENLYNLAKCNKVVAIGEIGLDYINPFLEWQMSYLKDQIRIANDLKLPVIIHLNNANELLVNLFKDDVAPNYGCVIHSLKLTKSMIKYMVANGYYIALDGTITYDIDSETKSLINYIPNDLVMVETDSPNLVPKNAISECNEASNISYIIAELASIKHLDYNEVEQMTSSNTRKLFRKLK